jgi:hypothetical protein
LCDVSANVSQRQLEAAHCWEADDHIPRRPAMTEFRRAARLHQSEWREANGHPIGTQPIVPKPGKPSRKVGSRLPLEYAVETGANFVTPAALDAARQRAAKPEPHQTFDHQRLWADLLWSPSLAINLFGDLAADLERADAAVRTWWPDAPGTVSDVRFAHSPGRFDPSYLNSLRVFDAAFVSELADGTKAIVAVGVRYHERNKSETPKPENAWRYTEVCQRSGVFKPEALGLLGTTELCVMWLEHLLQLSMLQHPSRAWSWGKFAVVYPSQNSDVAELCARYREYLTDQSSFSAMTLEELLDSTALPAAVAQLLRRRYVIG